MLPNVPGVVFACREMSHGFDIVVDELSNKHLALTRPDWGTVVVNAYDWYFALEDPLSTEGKGMFATEQIVNIVTQLAFTPEQRVFVTDFKIQQVIANMKQHFVAPTAVPAYVVAKFPLRSRFVQKSLDSWLDNSGLKIADPKFSAFFRAPL